MKKSVLNIVQAKQLSSVCTTLSASAFVHAVTEQASVLADYGTFKMSHPKRRHDLVLAVFQIEGTRGLIAASFAERRAPAG